MESAPPLVVAKLQGQELEAKWVEAVKGKLEELSRAPIARSSFNSRFRIFRVPKYLKTKRWHFQPELIFLGLFNKRFDPEIINLKGEKFKFAMVSEFMKVLYRLEVDLDWDGLCSRVVDDPQALQQCYYDKEEPRNRLNALVRYELTLDAIFLASFLSGYLFDAGEVTGVDSVDQDRARYLCLGDIIKNEGLSFNNSVANDIFKLENQIPLSLIRNVLEVLYLDKTTEANQLLNEICPRWIKTISLTLPGFSEKHFDKHFGSLKLFDFGKECDHLLACVCHVMRGNSCSIKAENMNSVPAQGVNNLPASVRKWVHWVVHLPGLLNHAFGDWYLKKTILKNVHKTEQISLPSMTRLRQAGIHVRGDARGTFDLVPRFKPGILSASLYIPTFSVVHRTEILWKNMVAYQSETVLADERGSHDQFIYFLKLMDELVNTDEDVSLLRRGRHPVIPQNLLGTEKDVAELFNSITQHYTVDDPRAVQWMELRCRIDGYVNQRSRRVVLEFLRYNLGKPWFVISGVAATLLLLMTFLQTFYTTLTYYEM